MVVLLVVVIALSSVGVIPAMHRHGYSRGLGFGDSKGSCTGTVVGRNLAVGYGLRKHERAFGQSMCVCVCVCVRACTLIYVDVCDKSVSLYVCMYVCIMCVFVHFSLSLSLSLCVCVCVCACVCACVLV